MPRVDSRSTKIAASKGAREGKIEDRLLEHKKTQKQREELKKTAADAEVRTRIEQPKTCNKSEQILARKDRVGNPAERLFQLSKAQNEKRERLEKKHMDK